MAAADPPGAGTPAPTGSARSGGFTAWFKTHRTEALIGGGVAVGAVALYMRSKANSASSSTASPPANTAVSPGAYDYTDTSPEAFNALSGDLSNLQNQVNGIQSSSSGGTTSTAAATAHQLLGLFGGVDARRYQAGGGTLYVNANPSNPKSPIWVAVNPKAPAGTYKGEAVYT